MSFLFTIVLLAIAGYVIYSAITAKGKLFEVENIIEAKIPQFLKILRPIYAVLGALMLVLALTSAYQNVVYSNTAYVFADDFRTYFSDVIKEDGSIEGTVGNVNETYDLTTMQSIFSNLKQPELPEGVSANYVSVLTDETNQYVFLGLGEKTVGQNETYTKLRAAISYKATQILTWVLMGVAVVLVIGIFVLINRFTDKEKLAKARAKAASGGESMPSSAFEFEESSDQSES